MKKVLFLEMCEQAITEGKGIIVYRDNPPNKHLEEISNHAEDVAIRMGYYDDNYDDNMEHKKYLFKVVGIKKQRKV